jgi:hypothetical protein
MGKDLVRLRSEIAAYWVRTDKLIQVLTSQLKKAEKRIKELEEKLGKTPAILRCLPQRIIPVRRSPW